VALCRIHIHTAVDRKVVAKAARLDMKFAVAALSIVYEESGGLQKYTRYFKPYVTTVRVLGRAFTVHSGENTFSFSHIIDVSSAIALLVSEALIGSNGQATWYEEGYYIVESSESSFRDDPVQVAKTLHSKGLIMSHRRESICLCFQIFVQLVPRP
jgi:hypothetical protein